MNFKAQIPNLLTLTNLASGFIGIVLILENLPEWAFLCLFVCLVADVLDGLTARLLRVSGELGAQLDSLADLVSFGALPSLLFYHTATATASDHQIILIGVCAIYVCCAAYRLGRFNVSPGSSNHFEGLPSPAAGLAVFSLCLPFLYPELSSGILYWELGLWTLPLILFLGFLMVSRITFISLKFSSYQWKKALPQYLVLIAFPACIVIFGLPGIAVGILGYLVISITFHLLNFYRE
nr:CDP-alcohol phosphatidyltransferase family protein [Saprospiraceae bacterium]